MNLTLPVPPSSNRYWRVWRGRAVQSHEARAYKQTVRQLALTRRVRPYEGHVSVRFDLWRPARRGDADNFLKVALDALEGVAFLNDSQVVECTIALHDTQPSNPRMEVYVEAVPTRH